MEQMVSSSVKCTTFEDILEKEDVFVYTNVGFSMMPLLREKKDIIEIRRKGKERCQKYDVVLYKRGSKYILHRILKVLPDGYVIAGDHCTFIETDIKDENILGIMTRVQRNGKDITPDNFWYKLYVHLWCDVYPVRMLILKIKFRIRWFAGGVKRRILRFVKK